MPKFLTQAEIYRMIQRELPPESYPDGPATAFFSTADSDATAKVLSSAYDNLSLIYQNYFAQSAVEKLADWEYALFGQYQDTSQTVEVRREKLLAKIRSRRGIKVA